MGRSRRHDVDQDTAGIGSGVQDYMTTVTEETHRNSSRARLGGGWTVGRQSQRATGGNRQCRKTAFVAEERGGDAGEFGQGMRDCHGMQRESSGVSRQWFGVGETLTTTGNWRLTPDD